MAASSSSSKCAACKFIGQRCLPNCIHAPCFPSGQPAKFAAVHRVFGYRNVTKLLNELHPSQRLDAANTLAYQAEMRIRDPVYGCVGVISLLEQQLRQLEIDLTIAKAELSRHQNLAMLWAYDQGFNVMGGGTVVDHYRHYYFFNNCNFEVGSSSNGGANGSAAQFQQDRGYDTTRGRTDIRSKRSRWLLN